MWAHSVNAAGRRHPLADHLRGTAELAARFAEPFGGERIAWWLGLLHDAGKASCSWQERLQRAEASGGRVGADHKTLGVRLATERKLGKFALAIDGHHGGLRCPGDVSDRLRSLPAADLERNADAERELRRLLPELSGTDSVELPATWREPLVAEMALRLLFSALCDADYLDTAAHFARATGPVVRPAAGFAALRDRFEQARAQMLADRRPSAVDPIRDGVYRACLAAADLPPSIFRLAAPTGSGKTLASAGFALHHAATNDLRRVVVAVPFLTITEQNAAVYRRLLDPVVDSGEPVVLEHHSGVDFDDDQPSGRWARLAAENWDAPFVVTTTVRLFEALFGRRPAAMRRVHRLVGSVIVLDEVQALPHRLLVPILDVLRSLVTHFGATVLLASATQPDFWHLSPFRELPATEVVREPTALSPLLPRVRFEWRTNPSPTLDELADEAARCDQAMVVVNTTADAVKVLRRWRDSGAAGSVAWHLSKRMCPDHRRRVLAVVRDRLASGAPVLLVSTQLIEAGVDVDFPVVYRALAPADSLLQAAGRANREGNRAEPGRVVIVDPSDAVHPSGYPMLVNATRVHFGPGKADPDDRRALRDWYRSVYGGLNLEHRDHVGQRIQAARRVFDFPAVTDGPVTDYGSLIRDRSLAFRMIPDDGIAVVTPEGAEDGETQARIRRLVEALRAASHPVMDAVRHLQPFVTTVPRSALSKPGVAALLRAVLGDVGQPGGLAEWVGEYDQDIGIVLDPNIEEFVL